MVTTLTLDNRARFLVDELEAAGVDVDDLKRLCTYKNPEYEYAQRRARGKWKPKGIPMALKSWRDEDGDGISFPRGVLRQPAFLEALAPAWKPGFPCIDERELGNELPKLVRDPRFALRPFQREMGNSGMQHVATKLVESDFEKALRELSGDYLWISPPASGKTEVILDWIVRLGRWALIVVPADKVFDEWCRRVYSRYNFEPGEIRSAHRVERPITVAMQQTMRNCWQDYTDLFGTVAYDEAQRDGAATFNEVVDNFPARFRLGATADVRRADGKEFLIYDAFGPVSFEVKRDHLVRDGFIHEAEVRIVPTNFAPEWYLKLEPDQRQFASSRLLNAMESDDERNALIVEVLEMCRGFQTLVMSSRVDHCRMLDATATERRWKSGLFLGGSENKSEFKACFERMHDGRLQVAFGTYQAVGVGFDLPCLERGIASMPCANGRKSEMQFRQYRGRIERISFETGKQTPILYYLLDQRLYGDAPVKNICRWSKRVTVRVGHDWVPAKEWLKIHANSKKETSVPGFATLDEPPDIGGRSSRRR